MRLCECMGCAQRRREAQEEAMVRHYMRTFDLTRQAAEDLLAAEQRSMWAVAVCHVSTSHRLDDDAAASYVRAHGIHPPERMQ
jgi:hypothetical protein